MDDKTLEVLRGSILKWEKIVEGTGSNHGRANCPLCHKFNSIRSPGCDGCPVMNKTGKRFCNGSPYRAYEEFAERCGEGSAITIAVAREELAFLRSLLPEGEK